MGKYKENPRYNVLSIRISDDEKALYEEIKRHTRKNMSMLIREAMDLCYPYAEVTESSSSKLD